MMNAGGAAGLKICTLLDDERRAMKESRNKARCQVGV
jgi:hypothetical protein